MTTAVESPTETTTGTVSSARPAGLPRTAWALAGVSAFIALVAVSLWVMSGTPVTVNTWFLAVDVSDAFVYGIVGAVILARRRHVVPWIFVVTAVGGAIAAFGAAYLWYALDGRPDLFGLPFIATLSGAGWRPGTYALFTIVPWLVAGPVRRNPLALACIAVSAVFITLQTLSPLTSWYEDGGGEPSPLVIQSDAWHSFMTWSDVWGMRALVGLGLVAIGYVLHRLRTGPEAERPGLGWLAFGAALVTLSFIPVAWEIGWIYEHLGIAFTPIVHLLSQAFFPGAVLAVVLRQRLWGIDVAVNRFLLWSLLTGIVAGLYVAVVWGATELFGGNGRVAGLLVTVVVAIAFQPVRTWVQRHVDRITYGDTRDALGVVMRLSERLSRSDREDELLRSLTETVAEGYRLGGVAIVDPDGATLAVTGDVSEEREAIALVRNDQVIGSLVVAPRPGEHLDRRTRDALVGFTPVLGIAVSSARLAGELRRSRAEVVRAQEDERRALRQELHDGLGPALAGVGLGLQGVRNLLAVAPDDAESLLVRLHAELEACVTDVRRISRDLRPAALDELGLVAAIDQLADRYRTGGLDITFEAADLPELPDETAVAAYRIVGEAMLNTHRHAGASTCRVALRVDRALDDLVIEVLDDGRGIAAADVPGIGLVSMEARAGQLGGVVRIEPGPAAGTAVRARLPLGAR